MKTLKTLGRLFLLTAPALVVLLPRPGGWSAAQIRVPEVPGLDKVNQAVDKAKEAQEVMKPWSYPEERATGRVLAAKVAANFGGLWKDEAWTKYVNMVGRSLVPYCRRAEIKYRFAILNTDDVNAYSCPGGYIFVTRGLLKELENEAQLAGVLAHEIAHVSQRHIEKEVKKQQALQSLLQTGLDFAVSEGDLTAAQTQLIKMLSDLSWELLVSKGLAKQDEYESDRVGTQNLYQMGYTPNGLISFLKKLREQENQKGGKTKILFSTHPLPSKRIEELKKFIESKGWNPEGRPNHAERFQKFKTARPIP